MSAIGRRSLLAVAAITLPMLIPLSAIGGAAAPRSEAGIKIISSDIFPKGQTGPAGTKGGFVVLADSSAADRLRLSLDGQALPERNFSILGKTISTRFELTPTPGVHKLSLTVVDKAGQAGETEEYSFAARAVPVLPTGKSAAAEAPIVVGGRFVEADGSPAVNLPVAVHMVLAAVGKEQAPLATATTRADGTWEAQIVDLPADVEKLATENNGVLNLQARASGVATNPSTGQPRAMSGVSAFSTGTATAGAGLTEAALRARQSPVVSSPLLPVLDEAELPPTPTGPDAESVEQRSPLTTQEKEYFEPTYFEFKAAYGDEKPRPPRIPAS
ncbi:hypothetical protein OG394_30575 [Kribbella sp. NBC_01245]|uniref:hypothetical protein n=1 Tax=Kribbella sp. NBC_01245 TaxID=2903578 RepID=UPI002E28E31A|nr:hypothetical protein [Kribbella sp. NBC_01245]